MTGPEGYVGTDWPFWEPVPPLVDRQADRPAHTKEQLRAEIRAALDGEAAKRQAALDGEVTRCEHCGRTEGLREPRVHAVYTLTACDCNYVHIRETRRYLKAKEAQL